MVAPSSRLSDADLQNLGCLLRFKEANDTAHFLDPELRVVEKREDGALPFQLIYKLSVRSGLFESSPAVPSEISRYFTRITDNAHEKKITELFWESCSQLRREYPSEMRGSSAFINTAVALLHALFAERVVFVADRSYQQASARLEEIKKEAPPEVEFVDDDILVDQASITSPEIIGLILVHLAHQKREHEGGRCDYIVDHRILGEELIAWLMAHENRVYRQFAEQCLYVGRYMEQRKICMGIEHWGYKALANATVFSQDLGSSTPFNKMLRLVEKISQTYPLIVKIDEKTQEFSGEERDSFDPINAGKIKEVAHNLYKRLEPTISKIYNQTWNILFALKEVKSTQFFRSRYLSMDLSNYDPIAFPGNLLLDGKGFGQFSTEFTPRHYFFPVEVHRDHEAEKARKKLKRRLAAGTLEKRDRTPSHSSTAPISPPSREDSSEDEDDGAAKGGGRRGASPHEGECPKEREHISSPESFSPHSDDGWLEVTHSLGSIRKKASSKRAITWGKVHQRVIDWIENPERALADDKYGSASAPARQRIIEEHCFPPSVDHFVGTGFSKKSVRGDGTTSYHLVGTWNGQVVRFEYGISSKGVLFHRWCKRSDDLHELFAYYAAEPTIEPLPTESVEGEERAYETSVQKGIRYTYNRGMQMMTIEDGEDTIQLFRLFEE